MKKNILIMIIISICLSGCWQTSEGKKNGMLVKISREGIIWGTFEGELIRGGFNNGSGSNGTSFHFSMGRLETSLVKKSLELMDKNKPVVISYHCELLVAPWRGCSKCFLDGITAHNL